MKSFFLLSLVCLANAVHSQRLTIEGLDIRQSGILSVKCCLQNGNDTLFFYKYRIDDICNSIMGIKIIRYPSKKDGFYWPCTGTYQLDNLHYNSETTFRLLPGEKHSLYFTVNVSEYPFKKSVKQYGIIVHLWNKELPNLERGMCDINLISNEFKFVLK